MQKKVEGDHWQVGRVGRGCAGWKQERRATVREIFISWYTPQTAAKAGAEIISMQELLSVLP